MIKKIKITIGIPAHNEEANIQNMIESFLKQKGSSFKLEKIIVILDGCTDNTLKIIRELAKKERRIEVVCDGKRTGKAMRLNQIHRLNKSRLIGTFDADIVLERDCELELMVEEFLRSKKVNVVAARQYPAPANRIMGRFSNASFLMLQYASMKWRNGNNIHSLQGSASILRKKFAKSFMYPTDTLSDQGCLYFTAIKRSRNSFKFAANTRIIFRAVSTFSDWRKLGARTMAYDRQDASKYFGKKILREYNMPKKFIYSAILHVLVRDPIGAIGSILMNIYIRKFPYMFKKRNSGIWEITTSSKASIQI